MKIPTQLLSSVEVQNNQREQAQDDLGPEVAPASLALAESGTRDPLLELTASPFSLLVAGIHVFGRGRKAAEDPDK